MLARKAGSSGGCCSRLVDRFVLDRLQVMISQMMVEEAEAEIGRGADMRESGEEGRKEALI
jgi:hypothetical protein